MEPIVALNGNMVAVDLAFPSDLTHSMVDFRKHAGVRNYKISIPDISPSSMVYVGVHIPSTNPQNTTVDPYLYAFLNV